MPVLTNIFLVEGLQERRGEGRRELEWRRWTGPADALQAALAVLLAAGFPALFEHHSEEDVTASMLVAGENDGDGDGDDGVRLPTSITVPRLWVFGAPTLLDSFLHHAMLHPFVSLQEDERGMWGGDSDDQATERLVVSLQRLLEGRLVSKGFERTEDGFVCPSPLPARRDGASAASSAIVCRIEAFSYGDRLGFYCSVGARAAARSLNLRSSNPEEDERSRFDGATTTRRGRRQGGGAAAASRAARHSDSEHSTPHAVSSSEFLAQVLIDQLGFNTSAAEEEEWTAPRPWASSGLTSPASAQDAMDMEGGAGLDSLEDRLAGKRTRATDASLLSPFSDAVGDSRSAKRSRPQEPSPLGGPLYASPTGGIVSPAAVTTASPLPDAAAVVKDEPAAPVAVPPPAAAAAAKAGKEDDAWYLLNDDSNDIDIDFESLIRSLSTEDSANAAAAAAAAVAAAAIMPPEPAVKPEPTATVMAPGALASPFDQFADVGAAAAMRDATAAAAAALLDGSGPDDAMILAGMSVSSSAPSPLTAAAATPTSLSEADVIATLEEPSSTQSAPDQAGERLLLHVWPTGYSPLPIPPTPPNARYSYRPTSQPSPSARVDSPSPAPPLSFRWWKRISESSSSSSSSSSASSITSSSTPSTSATTATATWSAAASAALSATPLLKSEVDDLLSPKSNGFVSPSSTSLSEAEEAEAKARLTEEIDDIGPELGALMVREVVMQQCSSTFDMLFLGISPSGLSLLDDSGGSGGPGPGSGSGGGPSTAWFVPTTNAALRRSSGGDAGDTTLDGAEVDPLFALVQQYSKDRAVAAQARSQLTAEGLMHALATVGQALNGHTQHQLQHHAAEADSFATGGLSVVGPLSLAQWNQEERAELEELAPPSLVVGFRDEWLNIPPTAIRLWEKALLEPYAPRKNVAFYALVPNDPLMSRALPGFLRDLTAAYQTANLGAHEPAIEDNIRWVELSDVEAAMRSYRRAAKDLAQELLRQWRSGSYQTQAEGSVVVYVVDPGPLAPTGAAPTAPQELLRCAVPLLRAAKDLPHLNIAFQILPTALLLEPWTGPSLRDLAFSVFSKCRRMSSPHSSEKLYEPVYVLAAPEPDAATTFVLHVAYSSSSTPQVPLLVIATLTDARGEMRQSLYLDSTHALAQLWQCALMAIARVSATWRIVIGKLGQLAAAEAQEWEGLVASWRAGGGRAGRARVASVALVQVTPHPHLHLLPALGSDLLPDLSASASQGSSASSSSSQGGSDGDPPVEVSTHAHRSLELELFDAWRTSSSLHLGNSYLLPRPPPAPGSVGALADPTAAAPMASVALLNPSLSQFHVRWPASTATLVISLVSLTDLQWSGEPQQHQAEAMLREVGRDYHRLSWLTLSSATGRRLLPLPLHFLAPAASSSFFSAAPST